MSMMSDSHSKLLDLYPVWESNDPPDEQDVPFIEQSLAAALNRLAVLKAEKDKILQKVATPHSMDLPLHLEARTKQLDGAPRIPALDRTIRLQKCVINAHKSILSAVRRLPPEILGEIFYLALPARADWFYSDISEPVPGSPWLLSHVCRKWRAAVRGNALLWSNIRVDTIKLHSRLFHSFFEQRDRRGLETQIALSANTPLSVDLWITRAIKPDSPKLPKFFEIVFGQSNRWKQLNVRWSGDPPSLYLLSSITGQLPHLQRLIFHPHGLFDPLPAELHALFAVAPALREVLLTGNDFMVPSPPLDLPWHQLERLRMCSNQAYIVQNLPKAVNLLDCAIAPTPIPLLLPNVRRLTLCDAKPDWLKLDTPLLEHLHLQACTDIVFQIMIRPMSNLRSLKLTNIVSDDPNSLFTVLRNLPAISHLELYFEAWNMNSAPHDKQYAFAVSFAAAMKISHESTTSNLCPRLISLRLVFPHLFHYPQPDELYHSFFEMVQSRWR
ncbi:hypothetical protein R3P38DRAFT_2707676, partial [Favolaschia claudopus]